VSFALVVAAPEDELEIVSAELFEEGALGVEIQDRETPPMPGTPPLPQGGGRCIAHFADRDDAVRAARAFVRRRRPGPPGAGRSPKGAAYVHEPIEIADRDWSVAWRAHHKALRVGPRTWVHPPWEVPAVRGGEVRVAIEPGMAFGTGSHATTALCLERLDELLAERRGADVLDVGTGSGVLAIQAVLLGARRVCGTDNDPIAVQAARAAAAANGLAPDRIEWRGDSDPGEVAGIFGVVVANILLNALVELAPSIVAKVAPVGRVVLSGLLADQGDAAAAAYEAERLRFVQRRERDGWVLVELERPR
jgi:ribosomal protein L11 methyltransferase